mmetsp:Transcript_22300/g.72440  ORF Transcript_22300/g.72440 Transcript_22300/m.72440 type:complete len:87 (-) Transcript_22300:144-404(-)
MTAGVKTRSARCGFSPWFASLCAVRRHRATALHFAAATVAVFFRCRSSSRRANRPSGPTSLLPAAATGRPTLRTGSEASSKTSRLR